MMWINLGGAALHAHDDAPVPVVAGEGGVKSAITNDVTAMSPRNRPKRKARRVSFHDARALAAEMHVIR